VRQEGTAGHAFLTGVSCSRSAQVPQVGTQSGRSGGPFWLMRPCFLPRGTRCGEEKGKVIKPSSCQPGDVPGKGFVSQLCQWLFG